MNENDINILLDHFVDGLEASESASIIQKIKTRPAWSDAYQKISRVFGSLSTVREQDQQQQAPTGLAHKTFQKILELENAKKVNCNFFAQKENVNVTVTGANSANSHKLNLGIKPSFLALCACAGFLFVITAWFFTTNFDNNSNTQSPTIALTNLESASQKTTNYGMEFALTGTTQYSNSSPLFNSNMSSCSATVMNCSASNKQISVNAPDKLVSLNDLGNNSKVVPHYRPVGSKIACPDGCAVFVSHTEAEGQPLIIVSSSSTSSNLLKGQKALYSAGNTQDNISIPVFYQQ